MARTNLCSNCNWFDRFPNSPKGLCRADTPKCAVERPDQQARWPVCDQNDWCGDWEAVVTGTEAAQPAPEPVKAETILSHFRGPRRSPRRAA